MATKTWTSFAEHLSNTKTDDELNDVTFTFNANNNKKNKENSTVKANRGLLSLLSPVFKLCFIILTTNHPYYI